MKLPGTPVSHFRLHLYAAVLALRARLPEPAADNGLMFVAGYVDELAAAGFAERRDDELARWWALVRDWEDGVPAHLPLRALREAAALSPLALTLLFTAGLVEEDLRFGELFAALNGTDEPRPTHGLLATWTPGDEARAALGELAAAGLLEPAAAATPRSRAPLQVPAVLWDALRGAAAHGDPVPWARHTPAAELPRLADLVLAPELVGRLARVPTLLAGPAPRALVVRGPRAGGRRTLVGAVARALGRGLLELGDFADAPAGPLATLLNALPVVTLDPAPGETAELPTLRGYAGPLAAIAPRRGGVQAARAVTLALDLPGPPQREAHWRAALEDPELARELAPGLRTTGGTIRRLAELAGGTAALAGRTHPTAADVRAARGTLAGAALETLARHLPAAGDWDDLAVGWETRRELELLEARCRHRERLPAGLAPAFAAQSNPGVRALLSGPSGTGKTLAARLLAARLDKDLFAVDLSAVVNKYLGETEKNLEAVFSRAEELDVVLLLDEGDALMARRTDVRDANDRYANLETNFLLQRLEAYDGILVATSNAADRIDAAFRRRLDVVVEFRAPDPQERWAIWRLHLPADHLVDGAMLDEVAGRCALTGGQIRNAVLHATLLALEDGAPVATRHVEDAVRREYRKAGTVCPLRAPAAGRA